jgi:hypothetical protein
VTFALAVPGATTGGVGLEEHGRSGHTDDIPEGTGPYVERITARTMTTTQDRLAARHATEVEREQFQLDEPAPSSKSNTPSGTPTTSP